MTRRTAAERHLDSAPQDQSDWPPAGGELIDALIAIHHPTRRRLYEMLNASGPANVGQLAARSGLAVGSVSHHLKRLHRSGFAEPAPDLARDTRESWWRGIHRRLSWDVEDFPPGSVGRDIADVAERNNFEHQVRAVSSWMRSRQSYPEPWNGLGWSADALVSASPAQLAALQSRLDELLQDWIQECRSDAEQRPDEQRLPVRAILRAFPSDPAAR